MDSIWTNGSWQVVTTSNDFLFHYFILFISFSLVLSYSSNGTQFISLSSIIDKVQRKGGMNWIWIQEKMFETSCHKEATYLLTSNPSQRNQAPKGLCFTLLLYWEKAISIFLNQSITGTNHSRLVYWAAWLSQVLLLPDWNSIHVCSYGSISRYFPLPPRESTLAKNLPSSGLLILWVYRG